MSYARDVANRKSARDLEEKLNAARLEANAHESVVRFAESDDFVNFLNYRLAKDHQILAESNGESLFDVGKAVGRAELILEIRSTLTEKKRQLRRAADEFHSLQTQAKKEAR